MPTSKMSHSEELSSVNRTGKDSSGQNSSTSVKTAIKFFVSNAPAGILKEVMENCELLVDTPSAVSRKFVQDVLEEAAEAQYQIVDFSTACKGDAKAVLCSAGRLEKSVYLNPPSKQVLSLTVSGSELNASSSPAPPEAFPVVLEEYRDSLETLLNNYLKERHSSSSLWLLLRAPVLLDQVASVFSHPRTDISPVPQLTAVMSAVIENASSNWTCSWASEWRIFFSPDDPSKARIEGDVYVGSYLREDSGVQAKFSRSFRWVENSEDASIERPVESSATTPSAGVCSIQCTSTISVKQLAEKIFFAIRDNEEMVMEELDKFFSGGGCRSAKRLRHGISLYGKPFDWKQSSLQLRPPKFASDELTNASSKRR